MFLNLNFFPCFLLIHSNDNCLLISPFVTLDKRKILETIPRQKSIIIALKKNKKSNNKNKN